jgi:hypothetical protein
LSFLRCLRFVRNPVPELQTWWTAAAHAKHTAAAHAMHTAAAHGKHTAVAR